MGTRPKRTRGVAKPRKFPWTFRGLFDFLLKSTEIHGNWANLIVNWLKHPRKFVFLQDFKKFSWIHVVSVACAPSYSHRPFTVHGQGCLFLVTPENCVRKTVLISVNFQSITMLIQFIIRFLKKNSIFPVDISEIYSGLTQPSSYIANGIGRTSQRNGVLRGDKIARGRW